MAIRDTEGWDVTSAAQVAAGTAGWTNFNGAVAGYSVVAGRTGSAMRLPANSVLGNAGRLQKVIDNQAEWYVGCALRLDGGAITVTNPILFALLDGTGLQCELGINLSRQFLFTRNNTLVQTIAGYAIPTSTWIYVEWHVIINNTTGVWELRVNETLLASFTLQNTRGSTANNFAQLIEFRNNTGGVAMDLDDMYFADGSGGQAFLGDCAVQTKLATAAGNSAQWTPSAGTNVSCIDETPPNDDTDYVSSATPGQVDTYAFADLAANSGPPLAVNVVMRARKDDAGSRSIAAVARPATTDRPAAAITVSGGYQHYRQLFVTSPETGLAWTRAELNGAEFGVKVVT